MGPRQFWQDQDINLQDQDQDRDTDPQDQDQDQDSNFYPQDRSRQVKTMKPWNPGRHIVTKTHVQLLPPANFKVTIRGGGGAEGRLILQYYTIIVTQTGKSHYIQQ